MKSACRKSSLILVCFLGSYVILAQDTETQKLEYFEDDNTFYLDGRRLSNMAIEQTLSENFSALNAWQRGNSLKETNRTLKVVTGLLLGGGGILLLSPIIFWPAFLFNTEGVTKFFIAGGVLTTAGIVTGIMIPITKTKYKSCYSDAASIYNKSKAAISLHIGITGNGLGFSLKF